MRFRLLLALVLAVSLSSLTMAADNNWTGAETPGGFTVGPDGQPGVAGAAHETVRRGL